MKVEFSPTALFDLEDVADYIAQDNPIGAELWVDKLVEAAQKVASQPRSGGAVPEVEDPKRCGRLLASSSAGRPLLEYIGCDMVGCVANSQAARVPERSHDQDAAAHSRRAWRSRLPASTAAGWRVAGTSAVASDAVDWRALSRAARSR